MPSVRGTPTVRPPQQRRCGAAELQPSPSAPSSVPRAWLALARSTRLLCPLLPPQTRPRRSLRLRPTPSRAVTSARRSTPPTRVVFFLVRPRLPTTMATRRRSRATTFPFPTAPPCTCAGSTRMERCRPSTRRRPRARLIPTVTALQVAPTRSTFASTRRVSLKRTPRVTSWQAGRITPANATPTPHLPVSTTVFGSPNTRIPKLATR
ncbi:Uncharacterised protein [Mycobacteroides abscessus subsp. abscessus]|nr:Uncharacterised protein [Mycobacteroides abscessus subsp. abscessus]